MINKTINRPKIMSDAFSRNMKGCPKCGIKMEETISNVEKDDDTNYITFKYTCPKCKKVEFSYP